MNYLSQLILFTEWKEVNQIPATAIALWYELMAVCNKCGWKDEFTVPNGLLQIRAGLSRKEFDRARQILISLERIEYKKSNRVNQAGKYRLVQFVQKGQREGQQEGQREGERTAHRRDNERDILFKLKQNETKTSSSTSREPSNIFNIFEKEFNRLLSPKEIEQIQMWLNRHYPDVIDEALRRSVLLNKLGFGYIDKILLSWEKSGYKTVAEIIEKDKSPDKHKNPPRAPDNQLPNNPKKEMIRGLYNI